MNQTTMVIDPVCGMKVDTETTIGIDFDGVAYHFCELACADTFRDDPRRWIEDTAAADLA